MGKSIGEYFFLGKPKYLVEKTVAIGPQQRINKIFEMGIPHGGNVVLYYQIFNPNKIVAIEHALEPVEPLPRHRETLDQAPRARRRVAQNDPPERAVAPGDDGVAGGAPAVFHGRTRF